ncbi:PEP-CTERM sorting domain-containing protein [Oscillatoria salina]|uniref:PEP-CTERM sorting domain-containing protein n=1 Tax=Oscillatoria salina TaxID=331517 RepID=UPI0013BCB3BB|nr:PEP-CTERM sorting domain-containing protein [Oscillatoria salina]MBZ8180829.1 PEP-CTERM sorting domain-containing protein [Oscillatoria salina IIICB1]NET90114.1 PEP-CTERM sorting domain-containing protein [Kamptonema sp. SIO1D9]
MKLKSTLICAGLVAGSAIAFGNADAQAFSFNNGTDLGSCSAIPIENVGTKTPTSTISTCTTDDGFTLTANTGGVLTGKTVNGVTGVGIYRDESSANQGSQQEIDFGEELLLTLDEETALSSLDIAFLYEKRAVRDLIDEVALITANGITGTLEVIDAFTAIWNWDGLTQTVNAKSPANSKGGALWKITNPFGDIKISSVSLTSPQEAGESYRYSDYAIAGAEKVPEPATVAGLALVAGALAVSRRRKSNEESS